MSQEDTQPSLTLGPFRIRQHGDFLQIRYKPAYDRKTGHVLDMGELRKLHKIVGDILAELPEEKESEA